MGAARAFLELGHSAKKDAFPMGCSIEAVVKQQNKPGLMQKLWVVHQMEIKFICLHVSFMLPNLEDNFLNAVVSVGRQCHWGGCLQH